MALEVTVGPPRLSINEGYGILVTELDGTISWPSDKGFYHADTRMISAWEVYADGVGWNLLNGGGLSYYAARIFLTNKPFDTADGPVPPGSLALTVSRSIDGGIHEDLDLVNYGASAVAFNLEIVLRSDFADIFEVKSGKFVRRGLITTEWSPARARIRTRYRNKGFRRDLIVDLKQADSAAVYANGRMSFPIHLAPGAAWHACMLYSVAEGEIVHRPPSDCIASHGESSTGRRLELWRSAVLKIETSNDDFRRFYDQSLEDMAALRLPIEGTDHLEFVPAGGVPWFVALFGRDALVISLQNAMVYPNFALGALQVLGALQARKVDDYHDAEPGKILHELRRGELAYFKLIPHTPYYGTADATILYIIVLHNLWRCIGDLDMVKTLLPVAERCLTWIDRYGDRDGDGFQEWQTRSTAGYENQDWKDSGESFVDERGEPIKGPKAACELQGYVYDAWMRMAQIYDALDRPARAHSLRTKARKLYDKFNEVFWDEAGGFYAYCLDGEKRPVLTVTSNPGHLLWSGIVPPERAVRVVERLMQPDMNSGWGIRTLSADNPAFNPYAYQRGAVWPHDNAFIAIGMRRCGFVKEAHQIAADITNAASYFALSQMPELYAGIQRQALNFPVQYLGANVPQGWAAGSCFALLGMIVGFSPDAVNGMLYLDPELPDWMPDLTLIDLRVGDQRFDIRFWRDGPATRWDVIRGDPSRVSQEAFVAPHGHWA
jgi:glycogen debranching enzyme